MEKYKVILFDLGGVLIELTGVPRVMELTGNKYTVPEYLIHFFDFNFPSHITSHLKPDIETYLNVIKVIGVKPDEILFFDDNEINIEGAKEAGIDAVKAENGIGSVKDYLEIIGIIQ